MTEGYGRDRVRSEEAEDESYFRESFETAPHGMALVSPEGRILRA